MEGKEFKDNSELQEKIKAYRGAGFTEASCTLFRDDVKYGISMESASMYMVATLSVEQQRHISKAIREHLPTELITIMIEELFDVEQIEMVVEAFKSGLPIEDVKKIAIESQSSFSMSEAFAKLKASLDEAKDSVSTEQDVPEEVKAMLSKLDGFMDGLSENAKRYDAVLAKLEATKTSESGEAIGTLKEQIKAKDARIEKLESEIAAKNEELLEAKESLKAKEQEADFSKSQVADLNQQLGDQQNKLNSTAARNVSLETKVNELQSEITRLKEEKERMENEKVQIPQTEDKEFKQAMQPTVMNSKEPSDKEPDGMPVHYQTVIVGSDGTQIPIMVERTERKKPRGLLAMAEMFMPTKSGKNLVKQMAGNNLNKQQMTQIRNAILSGLNENEVADIIDSGFSAEEMAEAIAVVVADKNYN